MTKFQLTFEIIKTLGLCYEVGHQGPNRIGLAMERFANLQNQYVLHIPVLQASPDSPSKMAADYLEYVYNGAPMPEWLPVTE